MELNRNHYFMLGLVVLFLGIQVKSVEAYVLTEDAAKVVAKYMPKKDAAEASAATRPFASTAAAIAPTGQRTVQPPNWLGWALISIGAVLILHSLAMTKPG